MKKLKTDEETHVVGGNYYLNGGVYYQNARTLFHYLDDDGDVVSVPTLPGNDPTSPVANPGSSWPPIILSDDPRDGGI